MRRTDVVVPAHLVASLRVPPLSVTDGGTVIEWVDVPVGTRRFGSRTVQRLPLDPRSARSARRHIRLIPWSWARTLVTLLAVAGIAVGQPRGPAWMAILLVLLVVNVVTSMGVLPRQTPVRDRAGGLRIPGVPLEVARQWRDLNPGVTVSGEPAPRPRSRPFYAAWSAGLLLAAVTVGVVRAHVVRDDSFLLWAAVPALVVAGCVMALKLLPPGYIRVDHGDD